MYYDTYSNENPYTKHYTNRSKPRDEELQHLVVFTSDNSFSIVKQKQCTSSGHDGLVVVHSGNKQYHGMILESGTLTELEQLANQMRKPLNKEIESDYERDERNVGDEQGTKERSNRDTQQRSTCVLKEVGNNCREISTTTVRKIPVTPRLNTSRQQLLSTQSSSSTGVTSASPQLKRPLLTTTSAKIHDAVKKKKPSNQSRQQFNTTISASIQRIDKTLATTCLSSDDDDDEDRSLTSAVISATQTSRLNSGLLPSTSNEKEEEKEEIELPSVQQLLFETKKTQTMLNQVLTGQARVATSITKMYNNQVKIQKQLAKRKIFIKENGKEIDLLAVAGTIDRVNLYVTALVDIVFPDPKEFVALTVTEVKEDYRYQLIKECVQSKFRLDKTTTDLLWCDLHEVVLGKRRSARKNLALKTAAAAVYEDQEQQQDEIGAEEEISKND
ncbi:unnamed protein product [Didymodactylos carnosus]|uniref:Uncharacterized protein n=1 Tax=Didymodactylos carnosus TaxID=1234261 RepID=A0A814Z0T9_9BILA|nr:unnamed protein product [Didymodactylos carnosus]CAF3998446.1 unnamed protein product [Didymodactylos carnosus]